MVAGLKACSLKLRGLRQESVLKSVHRNHIRGTFQQLCTFTGCDVTNRGKAVNLMCSLLLYRVLGLHIQLTGHLVTVVTLKELIQSLSVATNGAAYLCSVRSEYRCNLRNIVLKEQGAQTGHPLMCVINHRVIRADVEVVEALHCHCGCV